MALAQECWRENVGMGTLTWERSGTHVNMTTPTRMHLDGSPEKTSLTRVRGDVRVLQNGRLHNHSISNALR